MTQHHLAPVRSPPAGPSDQQFDLAVAAYLTRFTGSSREHARSDLRCFLAWCAERHLDPLDARRPHRELYMRWMQEIRRFKDLRSHSREHFRPRQGTRPSRAPSMRQGHQGGHDPIAAGRRPRHRPRHQRPQYRSDPAEHPRNQDGPARRHPPAPPPRPHQRCAHQPRSPAHAPAYLRHHDARRRRRHTRRPDRRTPRRPENHHAPTTAPARTSTATRTTSSPPTWPPAHEIVRIAQSDIVEKRGQPRSRSCSAWHAARSIDPPTAQRRDSFSLESRNQVRGRPICGQLAR